MKKLILFLIPFLAQAQKDSVYIVKHVDDMTDKVYYWPSRRMVVTDENKKLGVIFDAFVVADGSKIDAISCDLVGIGSCNENDELILRFADDTKIKMTSYAKFNCEGNAWFNINNSAADKLRSQKITKIMVINGRTHDSFTRDVPTENQDYYVQLFFAVDTKKIRPEIKK